MFKSSNLNLWLLETFWNPRILWIWHISGLVTRNRHILDSFDPPLRYEACAILEKNGVKFQKKPDDGRAFAKSDVNSAGGIFSTFERFWRWMICAFNVLTHSSVAWPAMLPHCMSFCNSCLMRPDPQMCLQHEFYCLRVFLVRKASNLFPAERGMKGLAFALDPDGYWIEIAACPVKLQIFKRSRFLDAPFITSWSIPLLGELPGRLPSVNQGQEGEIGMVWCLDTKKVMGGTDVFFLGWKWIWALLICFL